jgi:hypothetical protein
MKTFALSMLLSIAFLVGSLFAMRRQRLREQTAILWLLVSVAVVFMSVTLPFHLLDDVSRLVGVGYGPTLIFVIAMLFLTVLVFHLSVAHDRLRSNQIALVQQLGLLTAPPPPTGGSADGTDAARPPLADAIDSE